MLYVVEWHNQFDAIFASPEEAEQYIRQESPAPVQFFKLVDHIIAMIVGGDVIATVTPQEIDQVNDRPYVVVDSTSLVISPEFKLRCEAADWLAKNCTITRPYEYIIEQI